MAFLTSVATAHGQQRPASATPHPPPAAHAAPEEGPLLQVTIPGEAQLRYTAMTDLPLAVPPGIAGAAPNLGPNLFFEAWIRLRPRVTIGEHLRFQFSFDVARLVVPDAAADHVGLAREPRGDLFPYGPFDVREAYVAWDSPVGTFRLGQQAFDWGFGLVASGGDAAPTFGDYRHGDLVERLGFVARPGGRTSNVVLDLAADVVYRDATASLVDGDIALQGVASVYYQDHRCSTDCAAKRVGMLAMYRDVSFRTAEGTWLRTVTGDLFARWEWPTPDRLGRVFAGVEAAITGGATSATVIRGAECDNVLAFGGVGRIGIERTDRYRVSLEAGWASGDNDPTNGVQRAFTFNPAHRVGLILFPELVAWDSARSAAAAASGATARRLEPTNGAVRGAAYLYPTAVVNLGSHLDLRLGAVLATATTDWVDPASPGFYGGARNARGGDASRRDLGLELDAGLHARFPLPGRFVLTGGIQGAILFPGAAFADATGLGLGRIAAGTARIGAEF